MKLNLRATLAIALGVSVVGCVDASGDPAGGECTLMGCYDGLSVSFDLREPGEYRVTVVHDGEATVCTQTLPLGPCDDPSADSCKTGAVTLLRSGCALASSEHSLAGLEIAAHPSEVRLKIERDGEEIADTTMTPTYTKTQPNGPKCEPICEQATAALMINP